MNLKIREDSTNYTATVINLPQKVKVDGLDNLVKVTVFGNDCLIDKDSDESILYLFFPAGCQISDKFLSSNNLYRDIALNQNKEKRGFFEPNGRVKAVKFKGIISTGFVIPAATLNIQDINGAVAFVDSKYLAKNGLKVGDEFTDIDDVNICKKYIAPDRTQSQSGKPNEGKVGKSVKDLLVANQFRLHDETSHLAKNLHVFSPHDIISITDKWHGSSCILSKVLIKKKLGIYDKFINLLGGKISDREYGYIYSSGKPKSKLPKGVVHENETEKYTNPNGDYYSSNIWKKAFNDYKYALEDGISLYGELVGFTENGGYIQKGYDYKCDPGRYRFMIYRITYTKPDGNIIEFTWQQIKDYCNKYKLEHVIEFFYGAMHEFHIDNIITSPGEDLYTLLINSDFNLEKYCAECNNKVPAEGFVVRIDGREQFMAFKQKAKLFIKQEDDQLEEQNIENE